MKTSWMMFFVGAAASFFLIAKTDSVKSVHASPKDCTAWQYATYAQVKLLGDVQTVELSSEVAVSESSWEPFAVQPDGRILYRRCKP